MKAVTELPLTVWATAREGVAGKLPVLLAAATSVSGQCPTNGAIRGRPLWTHLIPGGVRLRARACWSERGVSRRIP